MKRFLVLLVVGFFSLQASFAQMIVSDAAVAALLRESQLENIIRYKDMVQNGADQIIHLKDQLANSAEHLKKTIQNLKSIRDIDSWDDFMDFYNRQLYLEKATIESVKGMNVTIGKKNYSLWDLEGIRDGTKEEYVEYWDKEFTEEQRREMWLSLGLTPSNYAYVQPYRAKGSEIAREMLAMTNIQNNKNIKTSEANKKDMDDLAKDSTLPEDKQMGDKDVQRMQAAAIIRGVEVQEDIAAMTAKQLEIQGVDKALQQSPNQSQQMSTWTVKFKPLKR